MAVIPALADEERRKRYEIAVASVGPFDVGHPIYSTGNDYQNWAEVWLDGVELTPITDWTLASPSGSLSSLARPITDAQITLTSSRTGDLDIVLADRPRRLSQFTDGVGVTAFDQNKALTQLTAQNRETWDRLIRAVLAPPGEVMPPLPPLDDRKGKNVLFHSTTGALTPGDLDLPLLTEIAAAAVTAAHVIAVADIASLRALTDSATATMAKVRRYQAGSIVGGGDFVVDETDTTSADDDGLIIVDTEGRRWKRQHGGLVTPEMFGGDANAAAAAAYAQDIPLYLTSGTASITINPTDDAAANTAAARGDVIENACAWQAKCIVHNKATLVVKIGGTGAHVVEGEIRHGDVSGGGNPTMLIVEGAAQGEHVAVATSATTINFGTKTGKVSHVSLPIGGTGTGYADEFDVTFTGGGGIGATATGYAVGGVIKAIVMTNNGTGYTSAPTADVSAGGGSGATSITVVVNLNVVEVVVPFSTSLPANVAVGMPVGLYDIAGPGDCAAMNGAGIIKAFSASSPFSITLDWTMPFGDTTPTDGTPTAGTVYFPATWLEIQGGYSGANGGFINVEQGAHFRCRFLAMRWRDGPAQDIKTLMSGIGTVMGGGHINVADHSIIVGFPERGIRQNQGFGFINRCYIGGGISGVQGCLLQSGGYQQWVRGAIGSLRGTAIEALRGCTITGGSTSIGSSNVGVAATGGVIDWQACNINACAVGVQAQLGGQAYMGSTTPVDRCDTGYSWQTGGRIIEDTEPTNSIVAVRSPAISKNTLARGGGNISGLNTDDIALRAAAFHAHKGGTNQTGVVSATDTKVTFTTEVFDYGGHYASSTWTPPAGIVHVAAGVLFTTANMVDASLIRITIYKNGAAFKSRTGQTSGTGAQGIGIDAIIDVDGDDTIEIYAALGGASDKTIDGSTAGTFFSGSLISR